MQVSSNNNIASELETSNTELSKANSRISMLEEDLNSAEWDRDAYKSQLQICQDSKSIQPLVIQETEEAEYRVLYDLDIRKHMTESSAVIGDVQKGETVKVINSFFSDSWEISYNGIKGWIPTTISEGDIWNQTKSKTLERIR